MSQNSSSKTERRQANRAAALELKRKQEAAAKRARKITIIAISAVLAVVAAIVIVCLALGGDSDTPAGPVEPVEINPDLPLSEVQRVPAGSTPDGGIIVTADGVASQLAPGIPTVGMYFDYLCGACHQFEMINENTLRAVVADGTANVVLYPVAFVDRDPARQGSHRAAEAMAWVADQAPAQAFEFHVALMSAAMNQSVGATAPERLADIARSVGVPDAVAEGIANGNARNAFSQWVVSATREWGANPALAGPGGGHGTPTITINHERADFSWRDPAAMPQALAQAAGR